MKKIVFAALLVLHFGSISGQSKVSQSKSELKSGSNSNSSSSSSSNHSSGGRSSNNNSDDDNCGLFEKILGYAFYGIYFTFGGDYQNEDHLHSNLTDYPYYNKESGNYENYKSIDADSLKKNFRCDLQNNFLYSKNDLYGNHLRGKIRPFQYFYAQVDFHELLEKNQLTGSTDQLSLFYFNLGYDRIRFENVNIGWTLGASYVGNDVKKAGFSVGLNAEVFLGHNISLLAAAKWSDINGKPVNNYELGAKYHIGRGFVSVGYEHLRIASPTYNFVSLGGGIYLN